MNKEKCQFGNCKRSGKVLVTQDGIKWLFVCNPHSMGFSVWKNKELEDYDGN